MQFKVELRFLNLCAGQVPLPLSSSLQRSASCLGKGGTVWNMALDALVALLSTIPSFSRARVLSQGQVQGSSGTNPAPSHRLCRAELLCLGASQAGKARPLVQNCSLLLISEVQVFFLRGCTGVAFQKCDGLKEGGVNQVEILISALLGIQKLKLSIIFYSNFDFSLSKGLIVLAEKKY